MKSGCTGQNSGDDDYLDEGWVNCVIPGVLLFKLYSIYAVMKVKLFNYYSFDRYRLILYRHRHTVSVGLAPNGLRDTFIQKGPPFYFKK